MFVRSVRAANGTVYLKIVENTWDKEEKKVRQKVLFNMGRLDYLQATGQIDLHHLYRPLDLLEAHKEEIQKFLLYPTAQHSLFDSPKLELVFYDTTTLRFESIREDLGSLCRFGYRSRGPWRQLFSNALTLSR